MLSIVSCQPPIVHVITTHQDSPNVIVSHTKVMMNQSTLMESLPARPKTKVASCLSCRRRKIKCDKEVPCSSCTRTGVECVPLAPSGLPRGRRGGRTKEITQLQQQITRLEDMLKSVEDNIPTGFSTKEEKQVGIERSRTVRCS